MNAHEQIEYATLTDVGIRRSHNQDAHSVLLAASAEQWQAHGHVFLVADGLGAQAVGELASAQAVSMVPHLYQQYARGGIVDGLRKAFTEANVSIYERGQQNPEFSGMGTTCTTLVLRPDGAWVGHVGDSRIYRVRQGLIEQLSYDHSLLWEKARRQKVNPDEIRDVPRNVICRSLGPQREMEVDVQGPHLVEEGDAYLLCSDGLSGPVSDPIMGAVVSLLKPAEACQFLVDWANLHGGPDNITVIVVRVVGGRDRESGPESDPGKRLPAAPPPQRQFPWPLGVLGVGVLLAALAVLLIYLKSAGGVLAFLAAALTLAIGIIWLIVQELNERRRLASLGPEYSPRVKVYRKTDCRITQPMLDELTKAIGVLVKKAESRQWDDVDWKEHKRWMQLAQQHLEKMNAGGAFRDYCRALLPLTAAMNRHRLKTESFQPHFEGSKE